MGNPAFFKEQQSTNRLVNVSSSKSKHLVDVGEDVNSGYRAIAVGIIDNMRRNPRSNHLLFSQVVAEYKKSYSLPSVGVGLQTSQERGEQLVQTLSRSPREMAKFVNHLAVVLRKVVIKEMLRQTEKYVGAFDYADKLKTDPLFTQTYGPLNEYAMHALSRALGLSIKGKRLELDKDLFACFNLEAKQFVNTVEILIEDNTVRAVVQENSPFSQVALEALIDVDSIVLDNDKLFEISEAKRTLLEKYHTIEGRLMMMYSCGEVSKSTLMDVYTAHVSSKDHQAEVITEHSGPEKLFVKLLKNTPITAHAKQKSQLTNKHALEDTPRLIKRIAQYVSVGAFNEDKVFEQLENYSQSRKVSSVRR